jgi:hypothetical protein
VIKSRSPAAIDGDLRRPVNKLPPLETKSQGFDMIPGAAAGNANAV